MGTPSMTLQQSFLNDLTPKTFNLGVSGFALPYKDALSESEIEALFYEIQCIPN